ncbi:hypothetical protein WJX77_004843 [Trebouxia sp. C0004]
MGRRMVQAQAQQQAEITFTESLEVVRCLLRVSIFHVSHLRGLFPSQLFKTVDMPNLGGLQIMMLKPDTPESRLLVDWVEGGVYDALKQKYLKCLLFGISEDEGGSCLMEEYVYKFNYDSDGGVTVDLTTNGKPVEKSNKKKPKANVSSVKYQVCRLIRMLVHICKTLDSMPEERYLFMKLTYHENTPEDYEPPHFKPITEEGLGHFARKPFSMNLGDVSTNHHAVSLRVKSLLDSCNEGLDEHCNSGQCSTYPDVVEGNEVASALQDDEARDDMAAPDMADGQEADKDAHMAADVEADIEVVKATAPKAEEEADPAAEQEADPAAEAEGHPAAEAEHPSPFKPNPKDRLAGDLEDLMTAPQEQSEPAYMDVMPLEGEGPAAADNAPGAAFSPDASAKYDAVMEFCLRRGQVLFTTLMTEFVSIHLGDLERFLQKMVQEGLLEPTESKDAYRVITQSGGEAPLPRSDPPHAVMESTRGADCSVMGPDGSEYQTALQQQQQHVTDQLGNLSVHHDGGEQGSGGRAANSRKRAAEDSQAAKVSCKGSENTNSAVHGQSAAMSFNGSVISPSHPHVPPAQPKDNFAWVESQQSMDNPQNKPRKASFVEKPIRQSKKQRTDLKNAASGMPARQHAGGKPTLLLSTLDSQLEAVQQRSQQPIERSAREQDILLRSQAPRADVSNDIVSSLQALVVKTDQVLSITSKGITPQEGSAQSLTPGSRLSTTQAEKMFSRLHVEFTYSGLYGDIEDQQHVQAFHRPPEATKDSVAEVACQHLQSTCMPEDVVVIAVQPVVWMGHEWPEAKVRIKETSRTDYVMVYRGLAPEMVDLLIDKQRMYAELKIVCKMTSTHRKGATDTSVVSELVTLKEQLAESKEQLHDAYRDCIAELQDLLLHTVGRYEARSEKAWTKVSSTAR